MSSFEGTVLLTKSTRSAQTCLAECVVKEASCQGARYNKGSHECQLLHADKTSSVLTTTFYTEMDWGIRVKVIQFVLITQYARERSA